MNGKEIRDDSSPDSIVSRRTVTVVVVNYNGEQWIRTCLDSLLDDGERAPLDVRIVVVDNCSSDRSREILDDYHNRILVLKSERNRGFGGGNNWGVALTSSDLVLLLNTDVKVPTGLIGTLVSELQERGLDAVAAREVPFDGGIPDRERVTIDPLGFPAFLPDEEGKSSFYLPAACVLITRSAYDRLGGFDENFFMYVEDVDFFWRARLLGMKYDFSRHGVIQHAVHGSSGGVGINTRRFLWRNTNQPMMLAKNYSAATLLWVAPLYLLSQVAEMVGLVVMGQSRAAWTYPRGFVHFLRLWPRIRVERQRVQHSRVVSDRAILALMFPGLAKLRSLKVYRSHQADSGSRE
ncbi:MAG: glycosyltransferase family 2 protein [Acidimicrobiaceae bacterium]|nr:glycosyltransferase family 2 protein [Acidimicrobiaceae bacterium]